jgi:hypothetical protein
MSMYERRNPDGPSAAAVSAMVPTVKECRDCGVFLPLRLRPRALCVECIAWRRLPRVDAATVAEGDRVVHAIHGAGEVVDVVDADGSAPHEVHVWITVRFDVPSRDWAHGDVRSVMTRPVGAFRVEGGSDA